MIKLVSSLVGVPWGTLGPVGTSFRRLHNAFAYNPPDKTVALLPADMQPLVDQLCLSARCKSGDRCSGSSQEYLGEINWQAGQAAVALSGGKDSVATVLKFQAQGLRVRTVHFAGLNGRSGLGEARAASELAWLLGAVHSVVSVRYDAVPGMGWLENPAKNCLVLGCLPELCRDPATADAPAIYALGTMRDNRYRKDFQESGPSDHYEVLEQTAQYMGKVLPPGFIWTTPLHSSTDTMTTILESRPDLLSKVRACFKAPNFLAAHRNRVQERYSVALPPGRCGCCYKCCGEWLHLYLFGHAQANPGYQDYCVSCLHRDYQKHFKAPEFESTAQEAVEFFIDTAVLPAAKDLW